MRNLELLVTALLVALFVLPASLADASVAPPTASAVPSAKLSVSVGVDPGGNVRFAPATILIPQVNLTLNVTFYNNYTTPGMNHTFTIFNADMTLIEISRATAKHATAWRLSDLRQTAGSAASRIGVPIDATRPMRSHLRFCGRSATYCRRRVPRFGADGAARGPIARSSCVA